MKILSISFIICFLFTSCLKTPCPKNIDLQPMYGHLQKCNDQIAEDNQFLLNCDSVYSSRKEASTDMLRYAWRHYVNGDLDSAMKRFNQAWLLDSLNADVYRGFGEVLVEKDNFQESVQYFDKSIELNPSRAESYKSLALVYSSVFAETKVKENVSKSIELLKKAVNINPMDAISYNYIIDNYIELNQLDSASKYLNIVEALDPSLVKPEVVEKLSAR